MRRNQRQRLTFFQAGLLALIAAVVVVYFGFTKSVPFRHHYTVKAVFHSANSLQKNSFVRIAGVNVGRVTGVSHLGKGADAAVVTMRLDSQALPLHRDATAKIRPRLFLEGNFFVDVRPGSPSAPVMHDGDTIPIQNTATPVQFDQVLTSLQSDTREELRVVLQEYGKALAKGGGEAYNRSIPYWAPAYKNSSIASEATLGLEAHDLSKYIASAGAFARALDRDPARLKSLVRDLSTFAGSLSREHDNLTATVQELPRTLHAGLPALAALNTAFPPVRRLARDALPGVRTTGPMIDASLPFLRQARALVSRAEARGLVADLRPTVPSLARLNAELVPLYTQVRLASSCQNEVILPWSHDTIADKQFPASGPVFEEGVKWLPGIAAESRSGDANGQWFRTLTGGGTTTLPLGGGRFAQTLFPVLGVNPPKPTGANSDPLRPDVPCETQQSPDLRTDPGPAPPQMTLSLDTPAAQARAAAAKATAVTWLTQQVDKMGLSRQLTVSPTDVTPAQLDQPGLGKLAP